MRYNELGETGMKVSHFSLGGAAFSHIYEGKELGADTRDAAMWCQLHGDITLALKGIPRDSYFIGSKVGRYDKAVDKMFDFSAEKTEAGVDSTLSRLGLEYIHDCTFAPDPSVILRETLPALARAVRDGKARYIGLADYDIELMKELVEESEVRVSTEQKVEIARLATWFSCSQPGVDTNVCGFYTDEQLRDTLDVFNNGLTEHEKNVLQHVQTSSVELQLNNMLVSKYLD
ncbi:Aldo/keto reductase family protein [Operophtera brumata]|uniref:Aldo/keto reductase family protein n=1 Tax=Operophtera brumata TaxID=104452 RepID=A0A0L7KV97_OPEBR|nr:Aldo/keto reductase family protein [Operophtera brumata]